MDAKAYAMHRKMERIELAQILAKKRAGLQLTGAEAKRLRILSRTYA